MNLNDANKQLHLFGEFLIKKKGIHYVAVVKDKSPAENDDFVIEIGVDSLEIESHQSRRINSSHVLNQAPISVSLEHIESNIKFFDSDGDGYDFFEDDKIVRELKVSSDIRLVKANPIKFQNSISPGKGIKNARFNIEMGTIAAIVELEGYKKDLFLLSNWHVLMGEGGRVGDAIVDNKNQVVGSLFWGIKNSYYDLALAKITDEKFVNDYIKVSPIKSINSIKVEDRIKKYGSITDVTGSEIISKNAYVKIEVDGGEKDIIFKNQILTEATSKRGDSGSLVITGTSNQVVGAIFAGDESKITVINHLSPLLQNVKIPSFVYTEGEGKGKYTVNMPAIKFNSIYVSESLFQYQY